MNKLKILVLIESSREFGRGLLTGIASYLEEHKELEIIRCPPYYVQGLDWEKRLSWIKNRSVDGVIMWTQDTDEIHSLNIPVVLLDVQEIPSDSSVVLTNNKMIGEMAAHYFLEHAFAHFAFVGLSHYFWSEMRCESFAKVLNQRKKDIHVYELDANFSEEQRQKFSEWLMSLPKPLALFAGNDDLALVIIDICNQAGIRVPEDVSLLGVDNDELICHLTHPPLSSIQINFRDAGFEAVRHLVMLIRSKREKAKKIYANPTNVITRQSTDIYTVEDPEVLEALRFIEQNTGERIQVTDVANHVALTRQGLNKKFNKHLGRSIHDEIIRTKMNYTSLLLNSTTLTVSAIAALLGYTETKQLSRVFRQRTGMSPTQYRQHHKSRSV